MSSASRKGAKRRRPPDRDGHRSTLLGRASGARDTVEKPPAPEAEVASAALMDILGDFSNALSLLAVAHGSLSAKELGGTGDEEVAIHHALDALKAVYSDLDRVAASVVLR
ncbi:MAG: hypothetical protein ACRDFS_13020 [Chloroflexota bacterium]